MYIIKWVPPNNGHLSVDKFSQLRGHLLTYTYINITVFFLSNVLVPKTTTKSLPWSLGNCNQNKALMTVLNDSMTDDVLVLYRSV